MQPMTLNRSMGWGLVLMIVASVVLIVTGFVVGGDFRIPGVIELESTEAAGKPSTEFFFNPLLPLLLAALVGLVIWVVSRSRHHDDAG